MAVITMYVNDTNKKRFEEIKNSVNSDILFDKLFVYNTNKNSEIGDIQETLFSAISKLNDISFGMETIHQKDDEIHILNEKTNNQQETIIEISSEYEEKLSNKIEELNNLEEDLLLIKQQHNLLGEELKKVKNNNEQLKEIIIKLQKDMNEKKLTSTIKDANNIVKIKEEKVITPPVPTQQHPEIDKPHILENANNTSVIKTIENKIAIDEISKKKETVSKFFDNFKDIKKIVKESSIKELKGNLESIDREDKLNKIIEQLNDKNNTNFDILMAIFDILDIIPELLD